MSELLRATAVQPLEGHSIRVTFSDGAIKDIDVGEMLAAGGVFSPISARRDLFEQVRVNPETGAVEWADEVDVDPEVLYGRYEPASGLRFKRRTLSRAGNSRAVT